MKNFLVLLFIIVGACNARNTDEKAVIHERVSVEQFKELLNTKEGIQLVDIRTDGEYTGGYIDGAQNIDFMNSEFLDNCNKQLDKTKPLAIYCAGGGRTAKALELLKDAGFVEVYELGVGYNGYK